MPEAVQQCEKFLKGLQVKIVTQEFQVHLSLICEGRLIFFFLFLSSLSLSFPLPLSFLLSPLFPSFLSSSYPPVLPRGWCGVGRVPSDTDLFMLQQLVPQISTLCLTPHSLLVALKYTDHSYLRAFPIVFLLSGKFSPCIFICSLLCFIHVSAHYSSSENFNLSI